MNQVQPIEAVNGNGTPTMAATENYQIGEYTLVDMYRGDWVSNQIFRPFHDRALNFVTKYNYETDVQWLSNGLVQAFHQSNPYWKMLVALDKQGKIVGHTIAYTETYQAIGNVAFLLQWEMDRGVREPRLARTGMKLILWDQVRDIATAPVRRMTESAALLGV